jgi:hypothetical protein
VDQLHVAVGAGCLFQPMAARLQGLPRGLVEGIRLEQDLVGQE